VQELKNKMEQDYEGGAKEVSLSPKELQDLWSK
jgi:hypothetical protein